MGEVIEGRYKVVGEKRRQLLTPFLLGAFRIAVYAGLCVAVGSWYRFAYAWGMAHVHIQLNELLR